MKRFIGLFTTLTPDFSGYYALSLGFSAKRVPTLVDLQYVHVKTAKYGFYQRIKFVLENTSCSLIRLGSLLSAEFVASRQKFDTQASSAAPHQFGVSPANSWDLDTCWHHAMLMPESANGKNPKWYELCNPAKGSLYQVASKRLLFLDVIANECEAIPGPDLVLKLSIWY